MSVLRVFTKEEEGGTFLTKWCWKQQQTAPTIVGTIRVTVDACHKADREALAEIQALYYILEGRQIQGENRLGNGIKLGVSVGAIRKALLKGSLKINGAGKTVKPHVAQCCTFLATKYFEAVVELGRWRHEEPRAVEPEVAAHLGTSYPRSMLHCNLIAAPVAITRHAMNRYVGRISEGLDSFTENNLSHLPDSRWTAAWHWFDNVLSHKDLRKADLLPAKQRQYQAQYGADCVYLHFPDARALLVLRKSEIGYDAVTILRIHPYTPVLVEQRYILGQRIVSTRQRMSSDKRSWQQGA